MRVLPIFELLNKLGLPKVQVKYILAKLYNFFLQKLFVEELQKNVFFKTRLNRKIIHRSYVV